MNKNDILTGKIEDLTVDGEGVAKVEGFPFFIKDTVIGDEVRFVITRLKKTYGYGKAIDMITPSPDRVEPACLLHKRCGGCTLQTMSYEAQLRFKEKKVFDNLLRLGEVPETVLLKAMEPIIGSEKQLRYRNKAQFPFGIDQSGEPVCGFYAARTHEIVPCTDCALGQPVNKIILETILDYQKRYKIKSYSETDRSGIIRHVLIRSTGDGKKHMVCIVINADELPKKNEFVDALSKIDGVVSISVNINKVDTNVILGERTITLWGSDTITDTITCSPGTPVNEADGDKVTLSFDISPHSFFQVNPGQTGRLYSVALEYAGLCGSETVWDLYCGIGTISLFMAKAAGFVVGVEAVPQAIDDARKNAAANGIENAEFICGKSEDVAPQLLSREDISSPEVIVVDPPRKGCDPACLDSIITASPDRLVYVSCDPATLARDIKILRAAGYELQRFRAVDQFCQTNHVEVTALLSKKGL